MKQSMKARKALNEVVSAPFDDTVYVWIWDPDYDDNNSREINTIFGPISKQEVARLNQKLKMQSDGYFQLQELICRSKEGLADELKKCIAELVHIPEDWRLSARKQSGTSRRDLKRK